MSKKLKHVSPKSDGESSMYRIQKDQFLKKKHSVAKDESVIGSRAGSLLKTI